MMQHKCSKCGHVDELLTPMVSTIDYELEYRTMIGFHKYAIGDVVTYLGTEWTVKTQSDTGLNFTYTLTNELGDVYAFEWKIDKEMSDD